MTHDGFQQTLENQVSERTRSRIASIGLLQAVSWLSLERSTREQAPVSPIFRMTLGALRVLEAAGVCEVDLEGSGAEVHRSIYDPVQWRYCLPRGNPEALATVLLARIHELSSSPDSQVAKLCLWHALVDAEAEAYFAAQLRKLGFDASWASRLTEAMAKEWSGLPLAKRRYAIWASCRAGASTFLSHRNIEQARGAIQVELRRRSRWVAASQALPGNEESSHSFLPFHGWRRPLMLDVFLEHVVDLKEKYWTMTPPPLPPSVTGNSSLREEAAG